MFIIFAKERAKIEIYKANEKIWRIPSIINYHLFLKIKRYYVFI